MLFLFAKISASFYLQKIRGSFLFAKKFRQIFCEQRGKPKIAYYGGVRGLGFLKRNFLFMLRMLRVCI